MTRVRVAAESAYDVVIGHDVTSSIADMLPSSSRRVAVISAPAVADRVDIVRAALEEGGVAVHMLTIPDGEAAKDAAVAARLWVELGDAGVTRTDCIVSVGGGATSDLVGFVASTWMRGVPVVHVPTTLLAMVDAAVGGKTGINTGRGKNLVGTIHEPAGVVCDLDALRTLPEADVAAGMAEVVKCGFIRDTRILELLRPDPRAALDADAAVLPELVTRAITVKADVVAGDLRESIDVRLGRETLNYGHTLGHAVERAEGYRWRHGDAISVGMVFVAELARLDGRLDDEAVRLHREILGGLGLPVSYSGAPFADLLDAMRLDKKARGDLLRFIVLDGIGSPSLLEGPSDSLLEAAFAEVSR